MVRRRSGCGFASAAVAAEDDAKADLAKLEGSWEIVAIEAAE